MNIIESIKNSLNTFLENTFQIKIDNFNNLDISLNTDSSKQQFGDITANSALVIAKELKKNPRDIAQEIINKFENNYIKKMEIAGPGFINIFLSDAAFKILAQEIYTQKENFFKNTNEKKINYSIEFVSANPTGPLHIGHGRGGIIGDVLGNILKFENNKVTKEFYINDAGVQIKKLGQSFKIRCQQQLGLEAELPEDSYAGEYLIEMAKEAIKTFGPQVINNGDEFFSQLAKDQILDHQKKVLKDYGINFDVWFSEKTLHESNAIENTINKVEKLGYIYPNENALWFKSTEFGDDKDRVVKKQDGTWTYVAPDFAYTQNKIDRGADKVILVLGQDHHSYLTRLKSIVQSLGYSQDKLDVILYQLVTIKESGEIVRLSKRAGRIVSLEDIINIVSKDVARFFYLNKKADAHLDFDVDLALKKTDENPVFYIQYAYVRTNSILEKALEKNVFENINQEDLKIISSQEFLILKKIISLKDLLKIISKNYQTHMLSYYVIELAQTFHSYYTTNKIINVDDIQTSRARLAITILLNRTLKTCFDLLGISAPERM